jgi:hypothetical protein
MYFMAISFPVVAGSDFGPLQLNAPALDNERR